MPNKFETIEGESELRNLVSIVPEETMAEAITTAFFREFEREQIPFRLTSADLAPGGFVHRD